MTENITISESDKAVLLGLFDGVHLGHRAALDALKACVGCEKVVYTFRSGEVDTKGERGLLVSDSEKEELLRRFGADRVIFGSFSAVRGYSCEEFVKAILVRELNAKIVLCGENFRFGKYAAGDAGMLSELCRSFGITPVTVKTLIMGGEAVSTTRIRALIGNGRMEEANELLGYRFFLSGTVMHGNSLGRTLGIRTVNLSINEGKAVPKFGVYSSEVFAGGKIYKGITNIGVKPTVSTASEQNAVVAETHILGFDGDLYQKPLRIELKSFYREEKKFENTHELVSAINSDIKKREEED